MTKVTYFSIAIAILVIILINSVDKGLKTVSVDASALEGNIFMH
jgi:hypothetical protein